MKRAKREPSATVKLFTDVDYWRGRWDNQKDRQLSISNLMFFLGCQCEVIAKSKEYTAKEKEQILKAIIVMIDEKEQQLEAIRAKEKEAAANGE